MLRRKLQLGSQLQHGSKVWEVWSGQTSLHSGGYRLGEKKGVLGSGPWFPPLEAQRAGALVNGFHAGHLWSE